MVAGDELDHRSTVVVPERVMSTCKIASQGIVLRILRRLSLDNNIDKYRARSECLRLPVNLLG
jgi:hypothetical protein